MTTQTIAKKATQNPKNGKVADQIIKEVTKEIASETKPSNTLEERIQRADELKALVDRRQIFVKKRAHIRAFQFGADEHSANLTIADQSGRQFTTGNGYVIRMLVDGLEKIISKKLNEIDSQIMKFQV